MWRERARTRCMARGSGRWPSARPALPCCVRRAHRTWSPPRSCVPHSHDHTTPPPPPPLLREISRTHRSTRHAYPASPKIGLTGSHDIPPPPPPLSYESQLKVTHDMPYPASPAIRLAAPHDIPPPPPPRAAASRTHTPETTRRGEMPLSTHLADQHDRSFEGVRVEACFNKAKRGSVKHGAVGVCGLRGGGGGGRAGSGRGEGLSWGGVGRTRGGGRRACVGGGGARGTHDSFQTVTRLINQSSRGDASLYP